MHRSIQAFVSQIEYHIQAGVGHGRLKAVFRRETRGFEELYS